MTQTSGGIVTSVEQLGAEAGAEMLRIGGNAADAAIAAAFAQAVCNPIHATIAGSFHGLFFDAETGQTQIVMSGGRAPLACRADMWNEGERWGTVWKAPGNRNRYGYEASLVPGFVRGAGEAFRRFGSGNVTWKQLVEPAIRLAGEGFEVYPYLYRLWMPKSELLHGFLELGDGPTVMSHTAECARVYLHEDGSVYRIGERLVLEDYAETLSRIANEGPDEFYEGETGHRIAADFAANGGTLTAEDLRRYAPDVGHPIQGSYKDLTVLALPPPYMGPLTLEILNIIEGWDLASLGWNTPTYLDRLARAMQVAFRDHVTWVADPDFEENPTPRMISKEYAAEMRQLIEAGNEWSQVEMIFPRKSSPTDTTHVSVADGVGNAALITHSSGVSSGVVTPGLGFQHNCHMIMFDTTPGRRNSIAPWKRPMTGGDPMLFLKDRLFLGIGSPAGPRKVTAIVQVIANMVEFGMTVQDAVAADRVHADEPGSVIVEPHFDPKIQLELSNLGHTVDLEWYTARIAAVHCDVNGALAGGTDPRGGGGLVTVEAST